VTLGQLQNGKVVRGTTGYDITYDALGRRTSATSTLPDSQTGVPTYVREQYDYDRIDRVKQVRLYNTEGDQAPVVGGSNRKYNAVGSLLELQTIKSGNVETQKITYTYDRDQRVQSEITVNNMDNSRRDRTLYTYQGDGILTSTLAETIDANGNVIANAGNATTAYAYEKWDSYKEKTVTVMVTGPRDWRTGTSTYKYDSNGHINELSDAQANRTIKYDNNQNGQVLRRYQIDREANGSDKPAQVRNFYYLNGRGVGDTGSDRAENRVDYAQQLAEQEIKDKKGKVSQINPQLNQRIQAVTSADFDQNFQAINDGFPAKTPGTHIVQPNETLQTIALAMYGDGSLWYLIADANGLTGNDQLVSGLRLTIPNVVSNIRNNAETFRPYDVKLALGDTTPTLPAPPPPPKGKKGCGALATILVVAVAIIVTVYTAGLAAGGTSAVLASTGAGATSTLAAGGAALSGGLAAGGLAAAGGGIGAAIIGGIAGSIVSQGVAIAIGAQRGFDFKAVALGGIAAGVGAGLGGPLSGALGKVSDAFGKFGTSVYTQAALHGAASSVLTQGIAVATGLQSSFSWRNVAISAVAAPVAKAFGDGADFLTGAVPASRSAVEAFANNFASGIGGSLVRKAFGSKTDSATLIADAFGSAVGQGITDELAFVPPQITAEERAQQSRELEEALAASQGEINERIQSDIDSLGRDLRADAKFARDARLRERELRQTLASNNSTELYKVLSGLKPSDVEFSEVLSSFAGPAASPGSLQPAPLTPRTDRGFEPTGLFASIAGNVDAYRRDLIGLGEAIELTGDSIAFSYRIADREYKITNRLLATAGLAGSVFEGIAAGALSATGVGGVAAGFLALNAFDNGQASVRTLITGEAVAPLGLQALQAVGEDVGVHPVITTGVYTLGSFVAGAAGTGTAISASRSAANGVLSPAAPLVEPGTIQSVVFIPRFGSDPGDLAGVSNLTSRGTLTNLRPPDPVLLQTSAKTLVREASGRYKLKEPSGKLTTPSGNYDFVTLPDGTIKVARTNTDPDFSTHLGLSNGREVRFAGEIRFTNSARAGRGQIVSFSNNSGHYRPPAELAHQAGLPVELFKPVE